MDYRSVINNIGYNQLSLSADIPDYKLSIGSAETLASLDYQLVNNISLSQASAVVVPFEELSQEKASANLQGEKVSYDDFNTSSFWLGSPTVGV